MGDKVGLGFNNTKETLLFSFNNIAFGIKSEAKCILIPQYLYMYYNRPEFDRYAIINSWGSATELFTFKEMCDIEINLPPLAVQQKYVAIYEALLANQKSYEEGLDDLKTTVDAILDKEKSLSDKVPVGDLLEEVDQRNEDGSITDVQGINITKQFMPSVANTMGVNLKRYKVVKEGQFAYSGMQTGRDRCIRIALLQKSAPVIVSPAYTVLQTKSIRVIPEYIMMWFSRHESDRRGWFMSDSSIRSNLDLDRFYETKIPLPDIRKQKAISDIYSAYVDRRAISDRLKEEIKSICPVLIKGSLEEGEG